MELNNPGTPDLVAKQVGLDIDTYCENEYNDGHRNHLGASLIGHDCKRYLWYVFRWCLAPSHPGNIMRLFQRGHREEPNFIEYLEGIGCKVWVDDLENNQLFYNQEIDHYSINSPTHAQLDIDVSDNPQHIKRAKADGVKFPQYRISDVFGHFGGSLDGKLLLPERYQIAERVLTEFKTINTKGFNKLTKDGMVKSQPKHFAQTSTYGYKEGLNYVLYLSLHKDTDKIHIELVKLDHSLGKQMIAKAEQIITSEEAPPKLSLSCTDFRCKFCDMFEICHKSAMVDRNCRSCKNAFPAEESKWFCRMHKAEIPRKHVLSACSSYKAITDRA